MLDTAAKPTGSERIQLAFRAPTYLGCTDARVISAVNAKVKESRFWTLIAPAAESYTADIRGERDLQYVNVTVQMLAHSHSSTWGAILAGVQSFSGGFFCWGTSLEGITLADAKLVPSGTTAPPLAKQQADAASAHSGDTRDAGGSVVDTLLGTTEAGFSAVKFVSVAAIVLAGVYVAHSVGLLHFRRGA